MRKVILALGGMATTVVATVGLSGAAFGTDSNHPDYWENQTGEECVKVDDKGAESGGYTVPAEPDGRDWSTLIIKKGSGNIGQENQVFENPQAGQTYTWVGNDSTKSGGWSHVILCSVPEPEEGPTPVTAVAPTFTDPCGPDNEVLTLPTTEGVTYTQSQSGDTITVTATANEGFVLVGQSVFNFTVNDAPCPLTEVTATAPTFTDPCGPDNEVLTLPTTQGVTYTQSQSGDTITVTATANEGFTLVGPSVFTFTVNDTACSTTTTTTSPGDTEADVLGEEAATNNGNNNNGNNNNGGNNNGGNNNGGNNDVADNAANDDDVDVLGVQASANTTAQQVPTVINAGTSGEAADSRNLASPGMLALLGAMMGMLALGMRRLTARS